MKHVTRQRRIAVVERAIDTLRNSSADRRFARSELLHSEYPDCQQSHWQLTVLQRLTKLGYVARHDHVNYKYIKYSAATPPPSQDWPSAVAVLWPSLVIKEESLPAAEEPLPAEEPSPAEESLPAVIETPTDRALLESLLQLLWGMNGTLERVERATTRAVEILEQLV